MKQPSKVVGGVKKVTVRHRSVLGHGRGKRGGDPDTGLKCIRI